MVQESILVALALCRQSLKKCWWSMFRTGEYADWYDQERFDGYGISVG